MRQFILVNFLNRPLILSLKRDKKYESVRIEPLGKSKALTEEEVNNLLEYKLLIKNRSIALQEFYPNFKGRNTRKAKLT